MYDVLVIGGGVIGCAIARELSRRSGRICVVERNEDVCTGTSKANSAIVHAGFDAEPGTRKARFNVEGSRMMEALSHELDFPYRRCGALVLCLDPADREKLQALYQRGLANGVEGLEIVEGEALHRMEPALSKQAVAALYAPTSAVRVHTTMVSANTSKMPHMPCCTGSFTLEAACTITEEPSPASLEKAPRLKPHVTARDRP